MRAKFGSFLLAILLAGVTPTRAVMFAVTGDASYNTNAPSGTLANSGWQYEGSWQSFLGTPIAPTFFLAAKHVGGTNGAEFVSRGFTYHTVTNYDCPGSDLRVWKVAETFPIYAPLYTNSNEVGRGCIVFGRGTQRGDAVIVGNKTNGWLWGASDGVQRWGSNSVESIANGGGTYGDLLACTFDRNAGSNECHLSVGDSSGAMFLQDGGTWKLAGIHLSVDGPFNTNNTDTGAFNAALLDMGGLWEKVNGMWIFHNNIGPDIPSSFYSTRVSANVAWINSVINYEFGSDLGITGIEAVGDDVQIHFVTGTNRVYYLDQCDDLTSGSWTTFTNNITGSGEIMTVIDAGAVSLTQRFYRVGLSP